MDLRKGNRSNLELPEIQRYGGSSMGHQDRHPYFKEMRILGASFTSTVAQSGDISWARVTGKVKALARDVYGKDLCLTHRFQYVLTYILSKIWHNAQIFLASKENQQLVMSIARYIWHGAIFRVPIPNLRRRKEHEGLELIDVAAKCRVLLITRLWSQGKREGSLTAEWLQHYCENENMVHLLPTSYC